MATEPLPPDSDPDPESGGPRPRLRPLRVEVRILLYVVGWILVLVGVVGGFLPLLQGWVFVILGAAILSVASQTAHRWLRKIFHRWPAGWQRLETLRHKIHRYLSRD